eukprot:CAMPEP_0167825756 /NCGR_PEP_ID=MMETSP0112_2-20121227/9576_1 /TAXON_ID=91324 /ORGANISM="Lotharella globosa, Strain CCCM811" /LENGTH=221 /DNA_ID=CAMNT_0007727965 /DNA_START=284 /DNA_END=949 /DNA_ORIENTATION=+
MAGYSNVRIPQVQSLEDDPDLNGRMDFFNLTITMPLQSPEEVYGVSALVFFDVKLIDRVKLDMSALTYISRTSNLAGSKLTVYGDLKFQQLYPLSLRGSRTVYDTALLDKANILSVEDTQFTTILGDYFARNESLMTERDILYWMPGKSDTFTLDIRYRIPKSAVRYVPATSEVLKFSWIQYLAVGVVVYFVVDWALYLTHRFELVDSWKVVENRPKEHDF